MLFFVWLIKDVVTKFFNEDGTAPAWLASALTVLMNLSWMFYDNISKPIFGDGEMTEEPKEERKWKPSHGADIEGAHPLLKDW